GPLGRLLWDPGAARPACAGRALNARLEAVRGHERLRVRLLESAVLADGDRLRGRDLVLDLLVEEIASRPERGHDPERDQPQPDRAAAGGPGVAGRPVARRSRLRRRAPSPPRA